MRKKGGSRKKGTEDKSVDDEVDPLKRQRPRGDIHFADTLKKRETNDGQGGEGKGARARCRFALRQKRPSFMRRDKAADRGLERKNMASLSGCEEEVNSSERKRDSETKRGKQARCPKQQLL